MAAAAMAAATAQEKQRAAEAEALQVQAQAMQAQLLQETRDAARKRKAKEMGLGELGEDELLAAEILSGSFLSGLPNCRSPPMSDASLPLRDTSARLATPTWDSHRAVNRPRPPVPPLTMCVPGEPTKLRERYGMRITTLPVWRPL